MGDNFFLADLGVAWTRPISQNFALNVGVRQQVFRYDRFSAFDFNGLNIGAGASYLLPGLGGIVLTGAYSYDRLTDRHQNEFYTNHMLSIGLQKTWVLSRAHNIFAAYDSDFSVATDPGNQRYHYHRLSIGYNVDLTRRFSGHLAYRLMLADYGTIGRLDVDNLLSLGFVYKITPWCNVSAIGSYIFNSSNRPAFEYQVGNVGANLGFSLRF